MTVINYSSYVVTFKRSKYPTELTFTIFYSKVVHLGVLSIQHNSLLVVKFILISKTCE